MSDRNGSPDAVSLLSRETAEDYNGERDPDWLEVSLSGTHPNHVKNFKLESVFLLHYIYVHMELIFASGNKNKAAEIQHDLNGIVTIQTLADLGFTDDIPETADTLAGNALLKAQFCVVEFGKACFADDTGLEIEVLHGEPGVFSARYAGEMRDPELNMQKVLTKLEHQTNRKACFKTVIALLMDGETHLFEGRVDGEITHERIGTGGFGYDPIFRPDGSEKTFGEMSLDEKSKFSHRSRAVAQLVSFLKNK